MSPITVSALLLVIFGIATSNGQSSPPPPITCYACQSTNLADPNNCANPNSNTPTCNGPVCIKTYASGTGGMVASGGTVGCHEVTDNAPTLLTRTCGLPGQSAGCVKGPVVGVGDGQTCVCTGDRCNSATRGAVSGIAIAAAALLVLVTVAAARRM